MLTAITYDDLPQVFSLCDRINDQMRFDEVGYPYSSAAMRRSWPRVIDEKDHLCFCHKTGDTVNGIFLARIQDNSYYMENYLVAYEIAFHSDPALNKVQRSKVILAIRNEAERRLKSIGVKSLFVSTHPGQMAGMDGNMKKRGYRNIAEYYVKEL